MQVCCLLSSCKWLWHKPDQLPWQTKGGDFVHTWQATLAQGFSRFISKGGTRHFPPLDAAVVTFLRCGDKEAKTHLRVFVLSPCLNRCTHHLSTYCTPLRYRGFKLLAFIMLFVLSLSCAICSVAKRSIWREQRPNGTLPSPETFGQIWSGAYSMRHILRTENNIEKQARQSMTWTMFLKRHC